MGNEISNSHAVHLLAVHQDSILPSLEGAKDESGKMIGEVLKIEIKPEEGVKYLTEFIGTREGAGKTEGLDSAADTKEIII